METENGRRLREDGSMMRYEIRAQYQGDKGSVRPLVVTEEELLPWVLRVVGVEAMRDFVLSQTAHARLTTQQAADQLGMSRPSLIKLLQDGALAFTMVGNRRYLEQRAVDEYRRATAPQADRFAPNSDRIIDANLRALQQLAEDEGDFS